LARFFVVATAAFLAIADTADAHAPPTPIIKGPLRVRGNVLLDADGLNIEMMGVNVAPLSADTTELMFKVIRRRWNLNVVRIPVSIPAWIEGGDTYLSAAVQAVESANNAGLAVVIAATDGGGLPSSDLLTFWRAWAERFKNQNRVIFDLYDKPSPNTIPGRSAGSRSAAEWRFWLDGGTATDGKSVVGMRQLVNVVRSTGATQVIAAQAFSDAHLFQGFESIYWLQDSNVIYEVHPQFDRVMSATEREQKFGFLTGRLHVYAGEWGLSLNQDSAACRRVPREVAAATQIVVEAYRYFYQHRMSWTASTFEPGSLINDYETYSNTRLDRPLTCGAAPESRQGMGEILLLTMTGDPTGFGELIPELIANAATERVGPLAPGEIIAIYGVEIGPYPGVSASVDESGRLPLSLAGVKVLFDDVPAPLFFASAYQVNVQVPYSVAGKSSTRVQLFYDEVPSSRIELPVLEASPGIFADFSREAAALNQDGSVNTAAAPATPGSIVILYGTGGGQISPARVEGSPAEAPLVLPCYRFRCESETPRRKFCMQVKRPD
jgi:uncharacterized protein (TIGR03437 family)